MEQLSNRDKIVVRFLDKPATAKQIADHCGISVDSIYPNLRLLQRLGMVEKIGRAKNPSGMGRVAIFKATGQTEVVIDDYVQISANNPFNLKHEEVCHA